MKAVMLVNAGMDEIGEATVCIRVAARMARELTMEQPARALELHPEQGGSRLTLRNIPAWGLRMILLGAS